MGRLGRDDLATRLAELSRQLRVSGAAIDRAFDEAFRELSSECATACTDAAGPRGMETAHDRNGQMYWALAWSIVDVVIIRIGGIGVIAHSAQKGQP